MNFTPISTYFWMVPSMSATSSWKGTWADRATRPASSMAALISLGSLPYRPGQLYAFVADLFDLFHGAGEILSASSRTE